MKIDDIIKKSNLDEDKSLAIKKQFDEFSYIASEWEAKAKEIVVSSEDQKAEMKLAREGRLFLKNKRVEIEKRRKALKEQSLREGQAIDAIARSLKELIEPIEKYLEDQEKYAERKEAERIAELYKKRFTELHQYMSDEVSLFELGHLSEEQYQTLLTGAITKQKEQQEAERKAEEERKAQELFEKKKEERVTRYLISFSEKAPDNIMEYSDEEFDKIISERELEREAQRKEREELEARLKAEAEAKEKLEAEIKAKEEAERKEKQLAELKAKEEEQKLALASDSEKLLTLSKQFESITYPEVCSELAVATIKIVKEQIEEIINSLKSLSEEC
jgi:hypothetical protein